jgi:hypothetical protein
MVLDRSSMMRYLLLLTSLLFSAPAFWVQKSIGTNPVAPFTLAKLDTLDADSSRVSGLSDSAKALVRYARITMLSDSLRVERTFDTTTARAIARDTATKLRAQVHDTADTLRKYTRDRIHDTSLILRQRIADSTAVVRAAIPTGGPWLPTAGGVMLGPITGTTSASPGMIDMASTSSSAGSVVIKGVATNGVGVYGGATAAGGIGVLGSGAGSGSQGVSAGGSGGADGLFAQAIGGGKAGRFNGDVAISGAITLSILGAGVVQSDASGNLSSSALTSASLPNSGVTAGTYGSATTSMVGVVDSKGRLTGASSVTITPAWASITSKPTTLSGYGITDGVSGSGTTNALTKWAGASTLGNSIISDDGTTVTSTGNLRIVKSGPALTFRNTSAATNEKAWQWASAGGSYTLYAYDDAESVGSGVFSFSRSGTTATNLLINPAQVDITALNGSGIVKAATGTGRLGIAVAGDFPTLNQSTTGNAATATKWATARTLTIGATGKTIDGSANVSWSLAEIGAQAAGSFLPLSAGSGNPLSGDLVFSADGLGVATYDGGRIYKKSGGGLVLRQSSGNQTPRVENNAGTDLGAIWYGTGGSLTNLSQLTNGPGYITSSGSITGSAATLTTPRTLTIGSTGKTFNGGGDVSWTLGEIGAAAANLWTSQAIVAPATAGTWFTNSALNDLLVRYETPGKSVRLGVNTGGADGRASISYGNNYVELAGDVYFYQLSGATTRLSTINASGQIGALAYQFDHFRITGSTSISVPGVYSVNATCTVTLPTPSASTLGQTYWINSTGSYTVTINPGASIIGYTPGMNAVGRQTFEGVQTGTSTYAWLCGS